MSYRRPGSTDVDTGSGRTTRRRQRSFVDPAMATLEATRGFTDKFGKRVNDVRDYENEVAQRKITLQDKVEGLKDLEDLNPYSYLQDDLMDMVSNINKLDIKSFEGDRSAYNEELSKINRILDNYQSFVGGLDATIDEYQAKNATELNRDISRTALQNDPRVAKYRKFLDNPSKAKFKIEDGEMVVYNGDERLFNAVEFVNSTKKGFQMVPYTPDMSDKITEVQESNYKGLDDLTKKIIDVEVKGKNRDYNSLNSTEKKNYETAINAYVERLQNDPAVDALVNESTFQRFIPGSEVYDKTKDAPKTKEEVIKFMVKRQFAGGKEVETLVKESLALKPKTSQDSDKGQESTIDTDGFDASPKGYIDRKSVQISTAVDTNNKKSLTDVITTELSSATGVDPQVDFDGNNLIITTSKSTGGKAYTAEEAKIINEASKELGGSDIIDSNGMIIDKEAFDVLQQEQSFGPPTGKAIQKPGEQIVIDNYKSPKGQAQLLNVLGRNRFGQKNRNEALFEVEKLTKKAEEDLLSGNRAKSLKARDQQTLKAIRNDAKFQSSNTQQVDLDNPGTQFTKEAVQFFNSLPKDFKVETFDDGIITIEEYLAKPSVKLGDLYNHYANAFEVVSQDRSKYPDAYMGYTMLDTQRRNIQNKKKKLD